jgi:anti-anti-sigma factor
MVTDERNPVVLTEKEGKPLLTLQGSIDIFAAQELAHVARGILERGEETLVSCKNLHHLDCAGVQLLLALKKALVAKGKNIQIIEKSPQVERLLEWTALS